LLHEKLDHIKDANHNLNKYWECRMKDRGNEKDNLVNKKLLKALEAIKVRVSECIFLF
jgi:hypothetical protein